jgi:hypothetical protein
MKSLIGVYESHDKAVTALQELQKSGYPIEFLSIIGKAELVNDHLYIKSKDAVEKAELSIGAVAGTIIGILSGVGLLAIPGFGILYGAGAFFGAITGLWGGIVTGGFALILTTHWGIDKITANRYELHIKGGNFMVVAQGNEEQLTKAYEVLHKYGQVIELNKH